jgi:hypothetical protein
MIEPKTRKMNHSRDVAGPKLLRSNEETSMNEKGLFHDDHPTGTIEKHNLADLHQGDHEGPLSATGLQDVVVPSEMGRDFADHQPTLHKGGIKDQSHFGEGGSSYDKESKSMGSGTMGARAPKGAGRSIAKDLVYNAKKRMK